MIAAIYYHGREGGLDTLMIQSQVFLSIALPVSMIPLVYFTSSEKIMGKRFRNNKVIAALGWIDHRFDDFEYQVDRRYVSLNKIWF